MGKYEIDALDFALGLLAAQVILLPVVAFLEWFIYG